MILSVAKMQRLGQRYKFARQAVLVCQGGGVSYKSCRCSVHGPRECGQNRDLEYRAICCLGGSGGGWGGTERTNVL